MFLSNTLKTQFVLQALDWADAALVGLCVHTEKFYMSLPNHLNPFQTDQILLAAQAAF